MKILACHEYTKLTCHLGSNSAFREMSHALAYQPNSTHSLVNSHSNRFKFNTRRSVDLTNRDQQTEVNRLT